MVRSKTWSKINCKKSQIQWFVFSYWYLSWFIWLACSPNVIAQLFESLSDVPANTTRELVTNKAHERETNMAGSLVGSSCYRPNAFLVSSSIPYSLPSLLPSPRQSLSSEQIRQLATERSGAANLVSTDSKSRSLHSTSSCKVAGNSRLGDTRLRDVDNKREILTNFQSAISYRLRQTDSASALKLHYGIAACLAAERIFDETSIRIDQQEKAQIELVEKGIPIPDPLLVVRLRIVLDDRRLENQSKIVILRTQLSALIGTENACGHAPIEVDEIVPSDRDVCEHVEKALSCRCDLLMMKRLRGTINADSLDVWDGIGALLSGVPALAKNKSFWLKLVRSKRSQMETQCAIAGRRKWLDDLIAERTRQISMEVDIAFEKKKTAALRWVKSGEQISNWETRIAQLEKLSEVQGNMASQFEARLNMLQVKGQRLERWVEWHQANVDLTLAVGCDL